MLPTLDKVHCCCVRHDIRRVIGILGCWQGSRSSWLWAFLNIWTNLGSRLDGGVTRDVRTLWDLFCFLLSDFLWSFEPCNFSALRASDSPLAGIARLEILFSIFKIKDSAGFRALAQNCSSCLWPGLLAVQHGEPWSCLCPILPSPTTVPALCHRHAHGQHWLAVCHHWHLCTLC